MFASFVALFGDVLPARNSRNPTSNGLLVCNMRMSHQPQKHDEPRCSCTDRLYNKSYSTGLENPNDEHDA